MAVKVVEDKYILGDNVLWKEFLFDKQKQIWHLNDLKLII